MTTERTAHRSELGAQVTRSTDTVLRPAHGVERPSGATRSTTGGPRESPSGLTARPHTGTWAPYVPTKRLTAIYDTDFLLNSVYADVLGHRTPRPLLPHGFASQHVLQELYGPDPHGHRHKWDKLAAQADTAGTPTPWDRFQQQFEATYLPSITFVDMGDLYAEHELAITVREGYNGRGASDAPTGQLAVLLSHTRALVYSHDRHLRRPSLAPTKDRLEAAAHADAVLHGHDLATVGVATTAQVLCGPRTEQPGRS